MKKFMELVYELAAEGHGSVPAMKVRLSFEKAGYLMRGYILTIGHVDL